MSWFNPYRFFRKTRPGPKELEHLEEMLSFRNILYQFTIAHSNITVPDRLLVKEPRSMDLDFLLVHCMKLVASLPQRRRTNMFKLFREKVPGIYQNSPIPLLELKQEQARSLLGSLYLIYVYQSISDMIGNAGDNSYLRHQVQLELEYSERVLEYIYPTHFKSDLFDVDSELISKRREATLMFRSLADTFGEQHAKDYFINAYRRLSSQLFNNDLSYQVLLLLPDEALQPIFVQDLEHHVSRRLLVHKLKELEITNVELRNEIQLRKVVTNRLRNSEMKLAAIIEGSMEAIILIDSSGKVTHWNKQAEEIFGYSRFDALGKPLTELIIPDELKERHLEGFSRFMSTGKPRLINKRTELIGKHKKGHLIDLELTIITEEIEGKRLFAAFIRDIGEQLKRDEKLRTRHAELEKVNKELDQFIYSTSHDLRAPLTSVEGLINIMEQTDDLAEIRTYLALQKKSIRRLDTFIKELADYSRNARLNLRIEEIDLDAVVSEVLEQYRFMNFEKEMQISKTIVPKMPFHTDNTRLKIILNNMISNVYKYADKEKAENRLDIKIQSVEEGVDILISDNGIGMDEDATNHVFEMFYRASSTSEGSGLGLYIVDEAVKRIKGSISLSSEAGVGTSFRIFLPDLQKKSKSTQLN